MIVGLVEVGLCVCLLWLFDLGWFACVVYCYLFVSDCLNWFAYCWFGCWCLLVWLVVLLMLIEYLSRLLLFVGYVIVLLVTYGYEFALYLCLFVGYLMIVLTGFSLLFGLG